MMQNETKVVPKEGYRFNVPIPDRDEVRRIHHLILLEYSYPTPELTTDALGSPPLFKFDTLTVPYSKEYTVTLSGGAEIVGDDGEPMSVPVNLFAAGEKVACLVYSQPIVLKSPSADVEGVRKRNEEIDLKPSPMLEAWIKQFVIYPDLLEYGSAHFAKRLGISQRAVVKAMNEYRKKVGSRNFDIDGTVWAFHKKQDAMDFENWVRSRPGSKIK